MAKPTLVVLAAGIGSRYGGLKQADAFGPTGEWIIDYSVYDAIHAGFGKVVFVIRPDIEEVFRERIGKRIEGRIDVRYVHQSLDQLPEGFSVPAERKKPWGTAHAVMAAEPVVQEPFAVINADDFYGSEAYRILASFSEQDTGGEEVYAIVGYTLGDTLSSHGHVSRGVCRTDEEGFLVKIEEMKTIEKTGDGAAAHRPDGTTTVLTGREPVSMNCWGFPPVFFERLRAEFVTFLEGAGKDDPKAEYFIPIPVDELIRTGVARTKVLANSGKWFGVTYQEDKDAVKASLRALIDAGEYPEDLWG